MPLVNISDELFNSLDDEMKSKLEIYEPEDTAALKANSDKLLSELKQAQADLLQEKANKKREGQEDTSSKDKLEDAMRRVAALEDDIKARDTNLKQSKIQAEALRIGTELAPTNAKRAKLLAKEAAARLDFEGDSFTILDLEGRASVTTMDELKTEFKTTYDFLVDAPQSSGGGSLGGSGGAVTKSYKEMSATEKAVLANKDPEKFNQLKGA